MDPPPPHVPQQTTTQATQSPVAESNDSDSNSGAPADSTTRDGRYYLRKYDMTASDEVRAMLYEMKLDEARRRVEGREGWRRIFGIPTWEEFLQRRRAIAEGKTKGRVLESPLHPAVDKLLLISGASFLSTCVCTPLDQAKLLLQCKTELYPKHAPFRGMISGMRHVAHTRGTRFLWRGLNIRILEQFALIPLGALYSSTKNKHVLSMYSTFVLAGMYGVLVLPLQVRAQYARLRLGLDIVTPGNPYFVSSWHTWKDSLANARSRGPGGLYRGSLSLWLSFTIQRTGLITGASFLSSWPSTWLTRVYSEQWSPLRSDLNWAERHGLTQVGRQQMLRQRFEQRRNMAEQLLFFPSLMLFSAAAYPLDTVVRRLMITAAPSPPQLRAVAQAAKETPHSSAVDVLQSVRYQPKYRGAAQCYRHIMRTEGIRGLYRGFFPHFVCVAAFAGLVRGFQTYAETEEQRRLWVRLGVISGQRGRGDNRQ